MPVMDVTPQLIEQIDFTEKFRGYDPDQVDDFLEQVGATLSGLQSQVENLSKRVERAESEAAALRSNPPVAESPSGAMTDEEEVGQAANTLMLAKRTADAAIAEARQEASNLLADARSRAESQTADAAAEADRLVRDAQTQREEMLRRAREDADREKVAQRDRLLEEIGSLDRRKVELGADIEALEARIGEYRSGLTQVHGAIASVLDDPASLRLRPSLGIDTSQPPTSSAFYYTGSNPVVSAAESIPLATAQPVEHVGEEEVAVVPPPVPQPEASGTADPWAPGSWSEVSAAFDERAAEVFEPAPPPTEAISRTPTDADRYLRDLDEAVNRAGTDDRAMEAFFEGGEDGAGRRFGRRR